MSWQVKPDAEVNGQSGTYFLRTSLSMSQETIWMVYNIIREVEATFRMLKTDLDLRPVYHKKDKSSMAHLHLGLLAYWVVNTIRYQLKKGVPDKNRVKQPEANAQSHEKMNFQWREIVRIMNTQKTVLKQRLFTTAYSINQNRLQNENL